MTEQVSSSIEAIIPLLPVVDKLSDEEAAIQLSTPERRPKTSRITVASLASLWGEDRAQEVFTILSKVGKTLTLAVLGGPGADPADPETQTVVERLVQAGVVSREEADISLYDVFYPAGDLISSQEVSEARALVASRNAVSDLRSAWAAIYNTGVSMIDETEASGKLPSLGQLRAVVPPEK